MKTFKIILIIAFLIHLTNAQAQVLEDLKAPSMPAATIIGTQVNEISKPKSMKALEAAIFNNYVDSSGSVLIPNNYAIEINPFMLSKNRNFDYKEYLYDSLNQNIWRNLSFSIASTNNFKLNDTLARNALGFGGRTILLNGKVNEELSKLYIKYLNKLKQSKNSESILRLLIGKYLKDSSVLKIDDLKLFLLNEYPKGYSIINKMFEQFSDTVNRENLTKVFFKVYEDLYTKSAMSDFRKTLEMVKKERYGLRWEIDAALALTFPTNDFNYSISPKYAVWSNLSYRPYKTLKDSKFKIPRDFEFIGLVRWIGTNDDFFNKYNQTDSSWLNTGNVLDIGIRAVVEIKKFTAEFEYIYRLNQNKEFVTVNEHEYSRTINDNTYKFVFNFNFNISDNIVLSYNIGQNYDFVNLQSSNLISGFTLNFGFGSLKTEDLLEAKK